jgi:hypothetical protein
MQGFRLVFTFRENPFFTNSQLVKTYHMDEEDDMLRKIESECAGMQRCSAAVAC